MRGVRARVATWVLGLAAMTVLACPPAKPKPQHPDADAAPVGHADCRAAAHHYAGTCATSDEDTSAAICQSIVGNKPEYSDCLMGAADCNAGTACDNAAGVPRGPAKPVNGR